MAWLVVTALTNQHSAFVPVEIGPSIGTEPDGTIVTNFVTQAGRVVIVGAEPLLEALRSTNGPLQIFLYATPGTTNSLQASADPTTTTWASWQQVIATNVIQTLSPLGASNRTLFIRAVRQ